MWWRLCKSVNVDVLIGLCGYTKVLVVRKNWKKHKNIRNKAFLSLWPGWGFGTGNRCVMMCHTHWDHVEWLRPDDIFQLLRSSSQMLSSWEFNWNFNSNMNVGECERRGCQARRMDLVHQRWIRLVWILDHFGIFSIKWPGISWWCFTS